MIRVWLSALAILLSRAARAGKAPYWKPQKT